MGRPEGNPGNKGGGRKSAYEEAARAKILVDGWFEEGVDLEELDKITEKLKQRKGKVKLFEVYLIRAIANKSGKQLDEMFKKLFPDKIEQNITGEIGVIQLPKREFD